MLIPMLQYMEIFFGKPFHAMQRSNPTLVTNPTGGPEQCIPRTRKNGKGEQITMITAIVSFSFVRPSDASYSFDKEIVGCVFAESQLHVQVTTPAV